MDGERAAASSLLCKLYAENRVLNCRLSKSKIAACGVTCMHVCRHQHGLLYLASEAYPRSGGPPVAELRTVSVADLQVQKSMRVPAKAINCLDGGSKTVFRQTVFPMLKLRKNGSQGLLRVLHFAVSPQVLVCGDDSGLVHVLDPTTLELRSQHHA